MEYGYRKTFNLEEDRCESGDWSSNTSVSLDLSGHDYVELKVFIRINGCDYFIDYSDLLTGEPVDGRGWTEEKHLPE